MRGADKCQMISARVSGKKFFQMRCINWSYRNRGYEARTQRNITDNMVAFSIRLVVVISGIEGM